MGAGDGLGWLRSGGGEGKGGGGGGEGGDEGGAFCMQNGNPVGAKLSASMCSILMKQPLDAADVPTRTVPVLSALALCQISQRFWFPVSNAWQAVPSLVHSARHSAASLPLLNLSRYRV